MPKRQMLSICQKDGYSVVELTDIDQDVLDTMKFLSGTALWADEGRILKEQIHPL